MVSYSDFLSILQDPFKAQNSTLLRNPNDLWLLQHGIENIMCNKQLYIYVITTNTKPASQQ